MPTNIATKIFIDNGLHYTGHCFLQFSDNLVICMKISSLQKSVPTILFVLAQFPLDHMLKGLCYYEKKTILLFLENSSGMKSFIFKILH